MRNSIIKTTVLISALTLAGAGAAFAQESAPIIVDGPAAIVPVAPNAYDGPIFTGRSAYIYRDTNSTGAIESGYGSHEGSGPYGGNPNGN